MSTSLSRLRSFYGELKIPLLLHAMITREFSGSIAALADLSASTLPLIEMIAAIEPAIPVLWMRDDAPNAQWRLSHVTRVQANTVHEVIEDKAFLAIISAEIPTSNERIALDADGVFRIYPYALNRQMLSSTTETDDWSV